MRQFYCGLYKAENQGEIVCGTPREIEQATGISSDYVSKLARLNRRTKEGWTVSLLFTINLGFRFGYPDNKEFIAENPEEDPIVGPVEEIALLTGIDSIVIKAMISNRTSYKGWTVRLIGGA